MKYKYTVTVISVISANFYLFLLPHSHRQKHYAETMHGIVRYSKLFKWQKVISSKKKMLQFYPILANFVTRKNPHFLSHEARGEPLINNSFF